MYYEFVDKFKIEPKSWIDLFEFLSYTETESIVKKYIIDSSKDK